MAFAVVIPSTVGYLPQTVDGAASIASAEQAVAGVPSPYRGLVGGGIAVLATVLAGAAFLFGLAQRSVLNGAATFVAGALLSVFVLGSNPWVWMRQGEPSIAGLWVLAVWPLAAIAWGPLMIAKRRQSPALDRCPKQPFSTIRFGLVRESSSALQFKVDVRRHLPASFVRSLANCGCLTAIAPSHTTGLRLPRADSQNAISISDFVPQVEQMRDHRTAQLRK